MINEPFITLTGNMVSDPELRFTPKGIAVASFQVASNPRIRNGSGEWEDGTPVFIRVIAWRDLAENICESLRRGDPVMVAGKFRQQEWEKDGEKRRGNEIQADAVGVPLDRRTVRLVKVTREHDGESTE